MASQLRISNADFDNLQTQCVEMLRDKDRLRLVKNAVVSEENNFSCIQAKKLIDAMHYGDAQVEAGKILYPALVDKEFWQVQVIDKMQFKEDKEALKQAVAGL